MEYSPLLRLFCIRHGESAYTNTFPDLTPVGVEQVKKAAGEKLLLWLEKNNVEKSTLTLASSKAPRALGTSHIIKQTSGIKKRIRPIAALAPMKWRNPEKCRHALKGLHGRGYIDYETEPIFANPALFETVIEMRERWYRHFTELIVLARGKNIPPNRIIVSHYEVLCPIVSDLFGIIASKETALENAETIELDVYEDPYGVVVVSGFFRNMHQIAKYDLEQKFFEHLSLKGNPR